MLGNWDAAVALGEWVGALVTLAALLFSWRVFRGEHALALQTIADDQRQRSEELRVARDQVLASERLAELTLAQHRASLLPVVCAAIRAEVGNSQGQDHLAFDDDDHNVYVSPNSAHAATRPTSSCASVALRNLGPGIAFLRGHSLVAADGAGWSGRMSSGILAPGETVRLSYTVPRDRPELRSLHEAIEMGTFSAEVLYTDVGGDQWIRARVDVHRLTGSDWLVRQVFLFRRDEVEPFASSGPAD